MLGRRGLGGIGAVDVGSGADRPSDAELLRCHVDGDPEAFGSLFLRHRDRLWSVALRTLCDPEEAADALQEAMVSAFRRAGDFRGDSAVTTWLHRIVVNASVDRLRRRSGRTVRWPEGGWSAVPEIPQWPGLASADPADATETRLDVHAALRLLPEHQRTVLVLVDMLGYPVAEAAAILGVSAGTVKSRCARGRARLLPYLSHLRTVSTVADSSGGGNQAAAGRVSSEQEGDA